MSKRQWKVEIWITQRELDAVKAFIGLKKHRPIRDDEPLMLGVFRRIVQLSEACKPPIVSYPGQD